MRSPFALDGELPDLCNRANSGSSWAALVVAMNTKPKTLEELMRVIGTPRQPGKIRERAFDAVSDAWAIYADALDQGARP